jgi:hypothetical protein
MPGGLVQIISSGTQDITLTGNPQITFFNIVYRRYTNFGKKITLLSFDNNVDFGSTSILSIPKNSGDLLSRLTLRIKLPKLDISKIISDSNVLNIINNTKTTTYQDYLLYYQYFLEFYNKERNIINIFFAKYDNTITNTYIDDLSKFILQYLNNDEFQQFFNSIDYFFNNGIITDNTKQNLDIFKNASLYKIINSSLEYNYADWTEDNISYDLFKFAIYKNLDILFDLNTFIYTEIKNLFIPKNNINICWANKIAIQLFNSIDLYIGSNKISSLSDYYINNYGNLYYKNQDIYNILIGNNQSINQFDIKQDETYLYLSLPFWFNGNYGLAFPLITLQYNSIQLKVNLKSFNECIKISIDSSIDSIELRSTIINSLVNNINDIIISPLEVTVIGEYIYLDNIERKKFAQSAHEYLITQVQEIEFNNISINNNSFVLDFFHCCKDMYWFAVKKFNINDIFNNNIDVLSYQIINNNSTNTISNINNLITNYFNIINNKYTLFNSVDFIKGLYYINNNLVYSNYEKINEFITTSKLPNTDIIQQSYIYMNSVVLIGEQINYFNYVQPFNYYNSIPQRGLNIYSFCLNPTETQPSGSCNLSRIPNFSLKLQLNNQIDYFDTNKKDNITNYKMIVQVTNFNILRFCGGIAATAYTY